MMHRRSVTTMLALLWSASGLIPASGQTAIKGSKTQRKQPAVQERVPIAQEVLDAEAALEKGDFKVAMKEYAEIDKAEGYSRIGMGEIPILTYYPRDGGPYIASGIASSARPYGRFSYDWRRSFCTTLRCRSSSSSVMTS